MVTFIAQRIMEAKDKGGMKAGQDKYNAYFGSSILQMLYGKYQNQVDAILVADDYGSCIVRA